MIKFRPGLVALVAALMTFFTVIFAASGTAASPKTLASAKSYGIGSAKSITAAASKPSSATSATSTTTPGQHHAQFCVYSAHTVAELNQFQQLLGRTVDCALIFNVATTWSAWDSPWYVHPWSDPNYNWLAWVKAVPGRRLILTQDLAPSGMSADWLHQGALGAYNGYAKTFAQNLINAGLGNSVIRLGHEANGTWYQDDVPDTAAGQADWRTYWANVVTAMRSIPGANFQFDWTANYQVRPNLSLSDFYPGDRYVDIVGLDAYDENMTSMVGRWVFQQARAGGINAVVQFANAHGKQLSFPEWGLIPVDNPMMGGGDDPSYISGIASTVASNNFAYTSYWYAHDDTMNLLQNSPASLAALRAGFGAGGTAR